MPMTSAYVHGKHSSSQKWLACAWCKWKGIKPMGDEGTSWWELQPLLAQPRRCCCSPVSPQAASSEAEHAFPKGTCTLPRSIFSAVDQHRHKPQHCLHTHTRYGSSADPPRSFGCSGYPVVDPYPPQPPCHPLAQGSFQELVQTGSPTISWRLLPRGSPVAGTSWSLQWPAVRLLGLSSVCPSSWLL